MNNKKPLVILAAVGMELKPLRKSLGVSEHLKTAKPLRLSRVSGPYEELYLGLTGMGPRAAKKATLALLDILTPRAILSVGLAGALHAELRIGDLVWAEKCHRIESLSPLQLHPEGLVLNQQVRFESIAELVQKNNRRVFTGSLFSSPKIVTQAALKKELAAQNGSFGKPQAVEMETASIVEAIQERGLDLPVYSLRAISDTAVEDISVDFERLNPLSFLKYFIQHPEAAWALRRLVRNANQAAEILGEIVFSILRSSIGI